MKRKLLQLVVFISIFFLVTIVQAGSPPIPKVQKSNSLEVDYSENGLQVRSSTMPLNIKLKGYIQGDVMKFARTADHLDSGTNLRRARFDLTGEFDNNWGYALSYDFGGSSGGGSLLNANVLYFWNNVKIKLGQMLPPFTMSNYSSNTGINFLELALPVNAMTPSYSQGLWFGVNNDLFGFQGSVFGPGTGQSPEGRTPIGATARVFYSPIHTETRVLHIGLSDWIQKPDGSRSVSFKTTPEVKSHEADVLLFTDPIEHVHRYNSTDLELAGVYGPFSFQGEYILTKISRQNRAKDVTFKGYYATASYFLTGESRIYSFPCGCYGNISSIRNQRYGAWQVLARYSDLNLNDDETRFGRERNFTVGLNWYVNKFVEFKFNYIRALAHKNSYNRSQDADVYAARVQVRF